MGKKKRPRYPEIAVLPNGERMRLCLFAVRETRADGSPKELTLLEMDTPIKLSEDGNENKFITGYVPEINFPR